MQVATKPCPRCGEQGTVDVDPARYNMWRAGLQFIQDALPELSVDDRERLITGYCPECWDYLFGDEEGGDDDENSG